LRLFRFFTINPEQGAQTSIYLAASPEVEGITGKYFVDRQAVPSSPMSYDTAVAGRLWQVSTEMTGLPMTIWDRRFAGHDASLFRTIFHDSVIRKLESMLRTICSNRFIGTAKVSLSSSTLGRADTSNMPRTQRGCSDCASS